MTVLAGELNCSQQRKLLWHSRLGNFLVSNPSSDFGKQIISSHYSTTCQQLHVRIAGKPKECNLLNLFG